MVFPLPYCGWGEGLGAGVSPPPQPPPPPPSFYKSPRAGRLLRKILPHALSRDSVVIADLVQRSHEAGVSVAAHAGGAPAAVGDVDMGQQGRGGDHAGEWLVFKLQVVQVGKQT